jgi:hypothetical protein
MPNSKCRFTFYAFATEVQCLRLPSGVTPRQKCKCRFHFFSPLAMQPSPPAPTPLADLLKHLAIPSDSLILVMATTSAEKSEVIAVRDMPRKLIRLETSNYVNMVELRGVCCMQRMRMIKWPHDAGQHGSVIVHSLSLVTSDCCYCNVFPPSGGRNDFAEEMA